MTFQRDWTDPSERIPARPRRRIRFIIAAVVLIALFAAPAMGVL